ncbi:Modification methylase HpaII [Kordia antarctica]|uniref:Cytosine-specific methyltransferase n=1 Tax=Kordia antarctica TaxID=1218801 RepID=A0A7L4ZQP4_9FLAO|nr:DNA cytosine methyltransferase [Kordia antarctica]QHI38496.1 Modification methylase HpaII [Kordia antarctica]
MNKEKFKFIDLFAGIGGIRMGFERNEFECVFSSEWDTFSQKTYLKNFAEMPSGDITKIDIKSIPNHDVLTAGFPCQPFSTIGKREGFQHPTQGTLFFDIVRILKEKKTSSFLLENVAGLKNHDKGKTFDTIIDTLRNELGYWVDFKILDSADFKVPQHRKRIYIVGFKNDSNSLIDFNWPKQSETKVGIGKFIETHEQGYNISKHLQNSYIFKKNDGRPQIVDENSNFPIKTLVSSYHKIQRLTGTFVKDGETGLRLLSENECKATMGFPKDFIFPVSRTQMYRQMGNSVAVPVIEAIANEIRQTLSTLEREVALKIDKNLVAH